MTKPDQHPSSCTFYCLEWLDFGANNDTPQWLEMAFPNYENEKTERDEALAFYEQAAESDPGRVRIVQVETRTQIIAAQGVEPQLEAEADLTTILLTDKQLSLLGYLLRQQQRQLDGRDGDPEPLAYVLQADERSTADRADSLTNQLQRLMDAVQLTHYRLLFMTSDGITAEQQSKLIDDWLQCFPTACIYQMAFAEGDALIVWHLYIPAADGQPAERLVAMAIADAATAGITFDHRDQVWGQAYQQFVAANPDTLVNAQPQPDHPIPSAADSQTTPHEASL